MRLERIDQFEKPNDLIGNQIRYLPTCKTVSKILEGIHKLRKAARMKGNFLLEFSTGGEENVEIVGLILHISEKNFELLACKM
jgi:hypothetical protein